MVKRIISPPIWLVFGIVAIFAFNEWLPGPRFGGVVAQVAGGALLLAGLSLLVIAGGMFKDAGEGKGVEAWMLAFFISGGLCLLAAVLTALVRPLKSGSV